MEWEGEGMKGMWWWWCAGKGRVVGGESAEEDGEPV